MDGEAAAIEYSVSGSFSVMNVGENGEKAPIIFESSVEPRAAGVKNCFREKSDFKYLSGEFWRFRVL